MNPLRPSTPRFPTLRERFLLLPLLLLGLCTTGCVTVNYTVHESHRGDAGTSVASGPTTYSDEPRIVYVPVDRDVYYGTHRESDRTVIVVPSERRDERTVIVERAPTGTTTSLPSTGSDAGVVTAPPVAESGPAIRTGGNPIDSARDRGTVRSGGRIITTPPIVDAPVRRSGEGTLPPLSDGDAVRQRRTLPPVGSGDGTVRSASDAAASGARSGSAGSRGEVVVDRRGSSGGVTVGSSSDAKPTSVSGSAPAERRVVRAEDAVRHDVRVKSTSDARPGHHGNDTSSGGREQKEKKNDVKREEVRADGAVKASTPSTATTSSTSATARTEPDAGSAGSAPAALKPTDLRGGSTPPATTAASTRREAP